MVFVEVGSKIPQSCLDFGKWAQTPEYIQISSYVRNLTTVGTLSKGMDSAVQENSANKWKCTRTGSVLQHSTFDCTAHL